MDSQLVVDLVHKGNTHVASLQPFLEEVLHLLGLSDERASVIHTYREAYRCGDLLANVGHEGSFHWTVLDRMPPSLGLYIIYDVLGLCTLGLIVYFVSFALPCNLKKKT